MKILYHIPKFLRPLGRDLCFSIPNEEQQIFLTFDDGPTPEITPWVLQKLEQYKAQATFFLLGKQVDQHPALVQQMLDAGHSIGHHTNDHPNGWETSIEAYLKNVAVGAGKVPSPLFRPPYGRITRAQTRQLKAHYRLVMWSDLSGDYNASLTDEQCIRNATQKVKPGSIVVFHDSEKCADRLKKILVPCLEHYRSRGFSMKGIPMLRP